MDFNILYWINTLICQKPSEYDPLWRLITENKAWLYWCNPVDDVQSKQWLSGDSSCSVKAKMLTSQEQKILRMWKALCLLSPSEPEDKTANLLGKWQLADILLEKCLKNLHLSKLFWIDAAGINNKVCIFLFLFSFFTDFVKYN